MARSVITSDVIALPVSTPITTPFTFSAWVFPTGSGDRSFLNGNDSGSIQIRVNANNTIYLIKRAVAGILISTATVTASAWNHVAVTETGSAQSITVNGGTPITGSTAVTYAGYLNNIYYPTGTFESFDGRVADWAIWSNILTQGEINALSTGVRPNRIRPDLLICYLPLDGLQSPEPDFSGNGYIGDLEGTTYAPNPPITMFTPRWPINYEEIIVVSALKQSHFRFRTDANAVDATPTWGADEDAA